MRGLREWGAFIILALFLGGGLVYAHFYNPNAGTEKLAAANIAACQRSLAKSIILEDFMNQAAEARRNSATAEFARGDIADYKNDLAAAVKYENDATKFSKLTPTDCSAQYPST